jgi:hypothetical protein
MLTDLVSAGSAELKDRASWLRRATQKGVKSCDDSVSALSNNAGSRQRAKESAKSSGL